MYTTSISSWSTRTDDGLTKMGVDYKTADGFQTVVDWYEGQCGAPTEYSPYPAGSEQGVWRSQKDGWNITVTVRTSADMFTEIKIMKEKA